MKRLLAFGHSLIPKVPRGGGEMRLLAFGHTLMPRVPRGVGGRGLGVEDIISFWPYPNSKGFKLTLFSSAFLWLPKEGQIRVWFFSKFMRIYMVSQLVIMLCHSLAFAQF